MFKFDFDKEKAKKIAIITGSLIAVFYFVLLLIIPNVIKLDKYKGEIQKAVYDSAKLSLDYSSAKIVTSPILSVGIKLKDITVTYPDKTPLLKSDLAEAKVAILPIILKTITIDSVNIKSPQVNLNILPDDRLKIEKYLTENLNQNTETQDASVNNFDFNIKLNKLKISDYNVEFKDSTDSLAIKGADLLVSKVILNKHANVKTKGAVLLNGKENISYDFDIDTFLPNMTEASQGENSAQQPIIFNPVKAYKTYDLKLNANSKLKIRDNNGIWIKGFTNVENISFKLPNKTLPESFVKLNFQGHKVDIDSNLNITGKEKATIVGQVNYSKKQFIDLSIKTDKIYMKSVQELINGFLDSLAIKHEGSKITSNGYLQADLNLKTNMKNIKSSGYFNVVDASFVHKEIPAAIKNVNINLDFANDNVKIQKFQAYLNDALFTATGSINNNAVADININSKNIQLGKLCSGFIPKNLAVTISSGLLSFDIDLKGRLDKIKPEIKLALSNFFMSEKSSNMKFSEKDLKVNLIADKDSYTGTITQTGQQVSIPNLVISNPNCKIDFTNKKININKFNIFVNSSPIAISGGIEDYLNKCKIAIKGSGNLKTSDIAKLVPKEAKALISHKGQLPVNIDIQGTPSNLNITSNIKANSQNHFSPVSIHKILGKQTNANISLDIVDSKRLIIKDFGLYDGSDTIGRVSGTISSLDKSVQRIDELKVSLPKALVVSIPMIKNSTMNVKGSMDVTGTLAKPQMNGNFYITSLNMPELKTTIRRIALALSDMNLNVKVEGANVNDSQFSANLDADLTPSSVFRITKMNLTSAHIDADKLFTVADKAAKLTSSTSSSTSSASIPVAINNGYAKINHFKMGNIVADNITGSFNLHNNLLKIPNFSLNAYDGAISGGASYNLITTAVTAIVRGNGINANQVATVFAQVKDQIFGTASFNANVSLKGTTYTAQMKSLKGRANFEVKKGQLGSLGKFENFIKAPNVLSQTLISTSIGSVVNTVVPYNSSQFDTLKGDISFNGGNAIINSINSSGTNMALHISGRYNLLNNNVNMAILGRISSSLTEALGPIGKFTTDKIVSYIPKVGKKALNVFSALTATSTKAEINKIPQLSTKSPNTQTFKVVLNGNIEKPLTLIKSFKWLTTSSEYSATSSDITGVINKTFGIAVDNTIKNVAKSVSQNVKTQNIQKTIQQNSQIRLEKIQSTKTGKSLKQFGNLLKDISN